MRPLRRQLKGLKAWITGQRKDQSPGTRQAVPVVQVDPAFEGKDGGAGSLVKYNPLSNVTSAEVWNFLRVMVSAPVALHCSLCYSLTLVRPTPPAIVSIQVLIMADARAGRAHKRPACMRLHLHRLRAMHAAGAAQPARARGPLVVGGAVSPIWKATFPARTWQLSSIAFNAMWRCMRASASALFKEQIGEISNFNGLAVLPYCCRCCFLRALTELRGVHSVRNTFPSHLGLIRCLSSMGLCAGGDGQRVWAALGQCGGQRGGAGTARGRA